ncbi:TNF receptor-associated factor 6-like [Liolophura sinensis]|uniref:TNF receptor-associated factor 6-like n=1 Tax=Liolophura sinensis TaxID=3198878 RepID=UPI0031588048
MARCVEWQDQDVLSLCATDSSHSHRLATTMEASPGYSERSEGYDYEFVPQPDPKYECPICLLILREPCQTECGHRFCRGCITRWLSEHETRRCPADNEPITKAQLFPDNFAKREILSLRVRCPNAKHGCDSVVELGKVQEHEDNCPMTYQPCPLGCACILFRKDVEEHVAKSCESRRVECPFCHETVLAGRAQNHQQEECPNITVLCQFCQLKLMREQIKRHLDTDCPNVKVKCVFSVWGCDTEVIRSDQANHQRDSTAFHLRLLSTAFCRYCMIQGIVPEALTTGSSPMGGVSSPDVPEGVSDLSRLMQRHSIGAGPGVTSSPRQEPQTLPAIASTGAPLLSGVTFHSHPLPTEQQQQPHQAVTRSSSLGATAGAVGATEEVPGTNTSTRENFFHFKSGQDTQRKDNLGMPFVLSSEFTSLKDQNMIQDESLARHDQHILELQNKIHMLQHSNQEFKQKVHYLEEKLSFYGTLESRACNGNFLWKVKNFSRLRREAEMGETTVLHSPAFYSSLYGYKMCVRVNLNGVDTARGTHMSIFVHFMQGEFDDVLDWPFEGKIILSVIDQNPICEIRHHIIETLLAKPNLAAFQRPMTQRNHKGFGYMEFVPLHILDSCSYVLNDILIIKAQVIPANAL